MESVKGAEWELSAVVSQCPKFPKGADEDVAFATKLGISIRAIWFVRVGCGSRPNKEEILKLIQALELSQGPRRRALNLVDEIWSSPARVRRQYRVKKLGIRDGGLSRSRR